MADQDKPGAQVCCTLAMPPIEPETPPAPIPEPSIPLKLLGARTRAMGSSNWEAYTVGTTLVASVLTGAGAGWWLDAHFKTTFWLPLLALVGVIVGFADLFRTVGRLSRESQDKDDSGKRSRGVHTTAPPEWKRDLDADADVDVAADNGDSAPTAPLAVPTVPVPSKPDPFARLTPVPPPPRPSWERPPETTPRHESNKESNGDSGE